MNEKTVSLCIRCGKVTANLLKAAMVKALAKMEQEKKQQGQKTNQKQPQKDGHHSGGDAAAPLLTKDGIHICHQLSCCVPLTGA